MPDMLVQESRLVHVVSEPNAYFCPAADTKKVAALIRCSQSEVQPRPGDPLYKAVSSDGTQVGVGMIS